MTRALWDALDALILGLVLVLLVLADVVGKS